MESSCFSGRLSPNWGNTAWAAMARLGSIGLNNMIYAHVSNKNVTTFLQELIFCLSA